MAHRSCYTQMTTDLKRVLRETEISSSALAASESRLYGYSLLRLLPSRYAEKLGLEREALQDVQQIGDFLDHLDGDRMNMLMRSVIFDCMDHIEEFRQTDETFELQLLRQFALQQDKETSERVIAEHLDRLEDAIQTRRAGFTLWSSARRRSWPPRCRHSILWFPRILTFRRRTLRRMFRSLKESR